MRNRPLKEEEESDFMKKSRAIFARPKSKQPILRGKVLRNTEKEVEELGTRQRAERAARTPEDEKDKLEKAKKMGALSDEYFPEMIDPALAITGAIAGGFLGGKFLDRLRLAMKSPDEKDRMRKMEIERAQQAAKKPVKMPPMRFGPKK